MGTKQRLYAYFNRHKLHLENKKTKERYVVAKAVLGDFFGDYSLSDYVRHNSQMIRRGAAREIIKTTPQEPVDPWLVLCQRHPTPKPVIMIGNRTVPEIVREKLSELEPNNAH